jgi:type I restriction enzyme S subunit
MPDAGWLERSIADCLETSFAGEWGSEPDPANALVLRATDIDDDGHVVGAGAPRKIPTPKLRAKQLQDGDILVEGSGGGPGKPVGRVALFEADAHEGAAICSNFFKTLRPMRSVVDQRFLWRKLGWFYTQPQLLALQQQTTGIINLKFAEYLNARLELPADGQEQAKIAEVLDTLDATIRQTEAIIEKLKQIKQGLLHDLLTRGIDANGELRPPQSQAPHLYKDSPLGWIPRKWDVRRLGELSASMTNGFVGTALPHYSQDSDAVPYLYGNNVRPNVIDVGSCARVSARFHRQQVKSQLAPGDLLTVQSGHIGTTAAVPKWLGEANCHALIITRIARPDVLPGYIACYCNSALGLRDMSGIFVGSTIPHINVKDFKRFMIPLPSSSTEQQAICSALEHAEHWVEAEDSELTKLRLVKSGLMDDLLTGRVRVTPLLA